MAIRIHPTAEVSADAEIGDGTAIRHHAQIREGARIGYGNPARLRGFVCPCGAKLRTVRQTSEHVIAECPQSHFQIAIPASSWKAAMSPSR